MISNRISEKSWDKNPFDKAVPDYNIALEKNGLKGELQSNYNFLYFILIGLE